MTVPPTRSAGGGFVLRGGSAVYCCGGSLTVPCRPSRATVISVACCGGFRGLRCAGRGVFGMDCGVLAELWGADVFCAGLHSVDAASNDASVLHDGCVRACARAL